MLDQKNKPKDKIDRRKQALRDNLRRRKAQLRDVSGKNEGDETDRRPAVRSRGLKMATDGGE